MAPFIHGAGHLSGPCRGRPSSGSATGSSSAAGSHPWEGFASKVIYIQEQHTFKPLSDDVRGSPPGRASAWLTSGPGTLRLCDHRPYRRG